jgi:GxxExxY protein
MEDIHQITGTIIDAAIRLHRDLGPGLLEAVYETILAMALEKRGLQVGAKKQFTSSTMACCSAMRFGSICSPRIA